MNQKELWQQKLIMLIHDPPGKMIFLRTGKHEVIAKAIFQRITGVALKYYNREPDRAQAGADRPIASPPTRTKGQSPIAVGWPHRPVITHPLGSSKLGSTNIHFDPAALPRSREDARELVEDLYEHYAPDQEGEDRGAEEGEREAAAIAGADLWGSADKLQEAFLWLWRTRPELIPEAIPRAIWQHQPADSRVPNHSLWDHLRLTSSLAFIKNKSKKSLEGPKMPWLLAFSIGPVQHFIRQSRTGTDLWTSSMILSDLMWHAMSPFVEQYGPESIVYPDLCKNPRADVWLAQQDKEKGWNVLRDEDKDPCSYAGIFPNTFVVLLPKGGEGEEALRPLQEMAKKAQERAEKRWIQLTEVAYRYWEKQAERQRIDFSAYRIVWDRQIRNVFFKIWSASAWPMFEPVKDPEALDVQSSLPAQTPLPKQPSAEDREAVERWRARHTPWIEESAFALYAQARSVYAKTNQTMHQLQRGFDYALIHHALFTRHALRKEEASGAVLLDEVGEKCTMCGDRQALGLAPEHRNSTVDVQRDNVRNVWKKLDPVGEGAERLCAVCAVKRVLVRAGVDDQGKAVGLTEAWAGPNTPMSEVLDRDGELRVPFPSTATLAAQRFLCQVVKEPKLQGAIAEVVNRARRAGLPRTTFVRALPSLATCGAHGVAREFLEYEAESVVFPETLDTLARRAGESEEGKKKAKALDDLKTAIDDLRRKARAANVPEPNDQIAVIAIDGDSIRKILLGTNIGATWRDVLHPKVLEAMETNETTIKAGWPDLLKQPRLMGPSTHAFINRVLAAFAHTVVPWVIEQEFSGRLIYAGGDDVLALAPASEALPIANRLSKLYRAAWVADTQPDTKPWEWRKLTFTKPLKAPRERFKIIPLSKTQEPITWPAFSDYPDAALLPMMGEGQTISAGVALGHYKSPLGGLIQAAREEQKKAKSGGQKGKLSARRLSRSGEKAVLRARFDEYEHIRSTLDALRDGKLASRLPYKLREVEPAVLAAWRSAGTVDERAEAFARAIFREQAGRDHEGAFALWRAGLKEALSALQTSDEPALHSGAEGGLSVCRYLASLPREEDQ